MHRLVFPSSLLLIAFLTLHGSIAYAKEDLNDLLESEKNARREYGIACRNRQLKQNYTEDILVEDGKVYKGVDCSIGGWGIEGYERWDYLGMIDSVESKPCQYSGNIQYQWTLHRYGKSRMKLVRLMKYNQCRSQWGVMETPVEIHRAYYPVEWYCQRINYKDGQNDPYETGKVCMMNTLR